MERSTGPLWGEMGDGKQMKKVLITGGLGHIGSHLIRRMPKTYDITIVDDMSTQRYCSLFNVEREFRFWERDISSLTSADLNGFDAIVHLAAKTNAAQSIDSKEKTFEINVQKTLKFIDVIAESDVGLFVFPSSSSVYGKGQEVMYEHDDNVSPQSPYANSKIIVEDYLKDSLVNHVIFRFGTIFGTSAGMRFHTAINKFCYQAAIGLPLTVWKQNYNQHRPYLGLNDAISAIEMALNNELKINEIYNVLTDNYKLSNIIDFIKSNTDVEVSFVDTPLLNQHTYYVNNDKICSFGFESVDDLSESIKKTMELLR